MAKCIKRAGIIFFVLVISCLLVVGITTLSNANYGNEYISDLNNKLQTAADNSVILAGSNEQKAKIWTDAINYSINNNSVNVKVLLNSDWVAENHSEFTTSFGEGTGFTNGSLFVPGRANITLDLNNHIINRNLTVGIKTGNVIVNNGSLQIIDSSVEKQGTIKGGHVGDFSDARPGGGIDNRGYMVMSSGRIANNSCYYTGGGVYSAGTFILNGGEIVDNRVYGIPRGSSGGGILTVGKFIMHGGLIARNYCIYVGGGFLNGGRAEIYGGEIRENEAGSHGAGIRNDGDMLIAGGIITKNTAGENAGGVIDNSKSLKIGAGTQIFGNTIANGEDNDLHIPRDSAVTIVENLCSDKATHIGIIYSGGQTAVAFTNGYSTYNSGVSPSRYFFSDFTTKNIALTNGEVCYSNESRPTGKLTWRWTGGASSGSTQDSIVKIPFSNNPYTISIGGSSFYNQNGTSATSFNISTAGTHSFYANGNYLNPTFTVIIEGGVINAPSHDKNTFTYSGSSQTYNVAGFDSNTMYMYNNTAINVGNYNAYILPKEGFVWQDGTSDILIYDYTILPKQLKIPEFTNKPIVYSGSEQSYDAVSSFDSSLMKLENNTETEIGKYKAKLSLIDNKNYAWDNGSQAAIEIPFEIVHPGILLTDNSKYEYIYQDNNIRKSYVNEKYIHRVNDSSIATIDGNIRYVMGGISTNTKLSVFLNNLRNDLKLIKVYDKNSHIIYDGIASNGIIPESVANILVGTGFKVELYENATSSTAFDTVYLSVLGDINGDGRITASDIAYLREIAKDNSILNTMFVEYQLAAMVNNKGGVTNIDSEILYNVMASDIELNTFFKSGVNTDSSYKYLTLNKENGKYERVVSETATNVIGNVAVNTKVSEFKANLAILGVNTAGLTIYKNEQELDDNAIVGTGCYFEIAGVKTYISVLGDLNGDGRISASDIMYARELTKGDKKAVQDCVILSALILNTGSITSADSAVLETIIERIGNIAQY